jgi:large subunit ribosomal protein L17
MRHQKSGRKLGRNSTHRKAMFSNMVTSLLLHERIETTEAKAKELRRIADQTISWGTSVGDLTAKGRDKLDAEERARIVHAMRMARRTVKDEDVLRKLFHEVAPMFRGRPGGYTRILKTRIRTGDAAPMAFVELVERTASASAAAAPEPEAAPAKGKGKAAKAAPAEAKAEAAGGTKAAKAKATKAKADEPKAPKAKATKSKKAKSGDDE